jgi:hypothetical protein
LNFWRENFKGRETDRAENNFGVDSMRVVLLLVTIARAHKRASHYFEMKLILAKVLVPGTLGVFSGFVFAD